MRPHIARPGGHALRKRAAVGGKQGTRSLFKAGQVPGDGAHELVAALTRGAPLVGPNDTRLVAMQRSIVLSTPDGDQTVRVLVALDWATYANARRAFFYAMVPSLAPALTRARAEMAPLAT